MSTQRKNQQGMKNNQTPAVTPLTFAERLRQSASVKEELELQYAEQDAKSSLEQDIRQTERQLTACKRERKTIMNAKEPNWSKLVQKDVEIEGYTRGLEALKGYLTELFPAE